MLVFFLFKGAVCAFYCIFCSVSCQWITDCCTLFLWKSDPGFHEEGHVWVQAIALCLIIHPFLRKKLDLTCIRTLTFLPQNGQFYQRIIFPWHYAWDKRALLKPIHSWEMSLNFLFAASLNETIVLLSLIYLAGALAALVRSWLFTLAGQRLVARIRKQASVLRNHKICLLILVRYFKAAFF